MSKVLTVAAVQGALVHQQYEKELPCPECAEARHELALMHQRPASWGYYRAEEGIRVLDIADDPDVSDAEREWLRSFRVQTPSMLSDTEVLAFVVQSQDVEQEIVVPHERLASLAVLASSPQPVQCPCGCDCGPKAAVVAPNLQGDVIMYCSPLCHQIQTNPGALSTATTIFGIRPKSTVWDGDSAFTKRGQEADAAATRDWAAELVSLDEAHAEWTDKAKKELFGLYTKSEGGLTLKMIADLVQVSESTISNWFRPFRP